MNTTNPFAHPIIDPEILTSEFDIFAMVQAMKDAQTFIKASPWKNFIISPFGALANATTDALKAAFARTVSVTVNHPAGSASMSPAKAPWGVVDSNLLLKGATGVRIVDASIFVRILFSLWQSLLSLLNPCPLAAHTRGPYSGTGVYCR